MLSTVELQRTHELLDHLPSSSLTTAQQRNVRRRLRHKLKEHHYATRYPSFTSLSHTYYFINRTTSDSTLYELIQTADSSSAFILDTESDCIHKQPNKPTLIQIQILLPNRPSVVLVVENCHLPRNDTPKFQLIQELFRRLFSSKNIIYIWGTTQELSPFVVYNLFTLEQINDIRYIDLQSEFKLFWTQHHPHRSSTIPSSEPCNCDTCIGKLPSELWSLQDSVAYGLHEYLSKDLRNNNFGIGLDKNLFHRNAPELHHRLALTRYVINDCLSMERIIQFMKSHTYQFPYSVEPPTLYETLELSSTSPITHFSRSISSPSSPVKSINLESTTVSTTQSTNIHLHSPSDQYRLSADERRRYHNRRCTVKQRARKNQFTITIRNIDSRFTYRDIRFILSTLNIPFSAINAPISKFTRQRSLHIGFTEDTHLSTYRNRVRSLFTSQHYLRFHHGYLTHSTRP